eukprot:gnl/MRDRNA2_/MRDRNA2_268020_c0_seq1.p1 gnl/MRDRNA2_/MRDRNA2_268020_c0~~gnl/MRDRNA2_/MRDRNA2_268020_c0_seq1.p1  ORF type:complete len:318 (+),score=35.16 gnl/MRDRNA2_/MRDRNA2_268020_c0_seq1:88-954(+)
MTDAADRSNNSILFPSTFLNSMPYGRLYSPALGPGRFYEDFDVYPWLPAGFFTEVSNAQFNWIAAYSHDAVYVALLSQSFSEESVTCVFNSDLVGGLPSATVTAFWRNNVKSKESIQLKQTGQSISFEVSHVPAKGIVALKVSRAVAMTRLHHKVLSPSLPPLSPESRVVGTEDGAFGIVSGMALRWGQGMTELYAFSQANSTMWKAKIAQDSTASSHTVFDQVTLHWSIDDGVDRSLVATIFPFDFTVPLPDDCNRVSFRFSGISSTGEVLHSRNYAIEVSGTERWV